MVLKTPVSTPSGTRHVLIVDDDAELSALLRDYLQRNDFSVDVLGTAELALDFLKSAPRAPDVLVLDVMLPGMDGLAALRQLRGLSAMPVLMLSGRGEPMDHVTGLELGADDYLSKPCMPRELLARLNALLRRAQTTAPAAQELSVGALRLHGAARKAWSGAQELTLTAAEFSVLEQLMLNAGQVISREDLTQRALHRPLERYDRAIDVHVSRLRQKLAAHHAGTIESVRGAGYVLTRSADV